MKRLPKKVFSLSLACAVCVSIAGCADADSSSTSDSKAETTTAPIVESVGDLDYADYNIANAADPAFAFSTEAEDCDLAGGVSVFDSAFLGSFSGTGFVSGFTAADSTMSFTYDFPTDGIYDFAITCAVDSAGASNNIAIDGTVTASFSVQNTTEFAVNTVQKVTIPKGEHTISITKGDGNLYVDKLEITASPVLDLSQYEVSNQLCNPNANDQTKRLYNFLTDVYGKYTLSGQYSSSDLGMESREFKEIEKATGESPAIIGLDLIEASTSRGGSTEPVKSVSNAIAYWNQGGIVTLCWHWSAPEPYIGQNGADRSKGFYTDQTTFSLAAALDGSDPEGYDLLLEDIKNIAAQLQVLQDAGVPVLWRPLHEAAGDPAYPNNQWFWWGASGAEAYKELWNLLYDQLTNVYQLNNLIWVWDGQRSDYYPGDETVDILGYDIYAAEHDYSSQSDTYNYLKSATPTKKIVALTENGVLFDVDAAFADGTRWAWFSVWNGEFTIKDMQLSDQYTEIDMWKKVYANDRVLNLSDLPDLKAYPLNTD